jgi:hypothetical protein
MSSRNTDKSNYGYHIYHVGQASDETEPRVLVLDDGEDVRFND